jgi:TolA-binding protein
MKRPADPGSESSAMVARALGELAHGSSIDRARDSATIARARLRFTDALSQRSPRRTMGAVAQLAFAAAVVSGLTLFATKHFRNGLGTPTALSYSVGAKPGTVGARYSAPASQELPLEFSEGTSVVLAGDANLRVVSTTDRGATVALEHGKLHAKIVHRNGTRWTFEAGPYRVHVTGTEFELEWEPATASFDIRLLAGSVRVTGCELKDSPVAEGESLHGRCDAVPPAQGSVSRRGATVEAAGEPEVTPPAENRGPPSRAARLAVAEPPLPPSAQTADDVKAPDNACETTPKEPELDAVLASGDADTLWRVAQCARRGGPSSMVESALQRFRARFAGDSRAPAAAYLLGKLAFSRNDFAAAETFFSEYRREAPYGPLAREAEGRLMETWQELGDLTAARRAAAEYLSRYPKGPHEALARRLLDR